jgi:hypothetical protein
MSVSPTEHFEHAEHAQHAAHLSSSFLTNVSITIAILAVVAATVGSLETIETAATIGAKNEAVLLQNKATDNWNFYQAKSIKKNMYEIAATAIPDAKADLKQQAQRYGSDEKDLFAKGQALEQATEAKLHESAQHEHRHEILTVAVTLLHVSIAIATISIIMAGRRWPWYGSIALGIAGSLGALYAYL